MDITMKLPLSSKKYFLVRCLYSTLILIIILAFVFGNYKNSHEPLKLLQTILNSVSFVETIIIILGYAFFVFLYARIVYNSYSYEIGKDGVAVHSGIINIKNNFIPYNKIQDVIISRGLIERAVDVSIMSIENANGDSNDIPGLPVDYAEQLRSQILEKMRN